MNLENIRIVLTRPLYGGNAGSVCRGMMNMGLSRLTVVRPTLPLREADVRKMALHAYPVYENRTEADTLAEAVSDCHVVAGTTARRGLYRAHARTIRDWAPELVEAAASGSVALVFGPEDSGLTNDEIALCTRIIQIPSADTYSSLNLSHAVLVCCYELYVASGQYEPMEEASAEASSEQREIMFGIWEDMLNEIGFMKEGMSEHMMFGVRRILSRGRLTDRDVRILMGIAKQARWCAGEVERLHGESGRSR